MGVMIVGLVVFLASHLVPVATGTRQRLSVALGDNGYRLLISGAAIVGFVLLVWGYGLWRAAGPAQLWVPAAGLRHLALLVMLPVFPLLFAAYMPGRIKAAVRHPMITAVGVWAFAHLLANGDAASALLFGSFLAWSVVDRVSVARREHAGLLRVEAAGPIRNDIAAVVLGLIVYGLFVSRLHLWLIGVAPIG